MKSVLLIYPSMHYSKEFFLMEMPPLGLEFLAAYIEGKARVEIMDLRFDKDIPDRIQKLKPDIIGINFQNAVRSGDAYKVGEICRNHADATMIAGGLHATTCPKEVLASPNFDIVVRGEAEQQLLDIVKGIPLQDILGISYKDGKQLIHNEDRPLMQDLDELPHPARHLRSPNTNYSIFNRKIKADLLATSRGCRGNCTFCSPATFYQGQWRGHSPEWVIEDLKQIQSKFVLLSDDDFMADLDRTEQICDLITKEGLEKTFYVQSRMLVGHMDLKRKLAKAGFYYITFGLETPKKENLAKYKKGMAASQAKQVIKEWYDAGIQFVNTSLVFGDPDDSEEDLLRIGDFAREVDSGFADMIWMTPYPATPLTADLEKEGLILSKDWSQYTQGILLVRSKKVPEDRLKELRQLAWFRYFTPRKIARFIRFSQWMARKYGVSSMEGLTWMVFYRPILFGDVYETDPKGMKRIRRLGLRTYFKEYLNSFSSQERDMTEDLNKILQITDFGGLLSLLKDQVIQLTVYSKKYPLTNVLIEIGENSIKKCIVNPERVETTNQFDVDLKDLIDLLTHESGDEQKNLVYTIGMINGMLIKNLMKHSYSKEIKSLIDAMIESKFWKDFDLKYDF